MFSKLNHHQMALYQVADFIFSHIDIDMSYAEFVDDLPISLVGSPAISCGLNKRNISVVIFVGLSKHRVLGVPRHSLVSRDLCHQNGDLVAIAAYSIYSIYSPCSNRPKLHKIG